MESADLSLRESVKAYDSFRAEYDALARRAEPYLNDPTITEGAKASLRTALNAALACGDLFVGLGLPSTLSATVLKGVSKVDKILKWMRVPLREKKAGDASTLQVLDLTPDVKLRTSLGFQLLEICSAGFLPMRSLEGVMQMKHDIPRVWAAYKRIREIAAAKATIAPDVQNAIDVFSANGGAV
jgi:hypothetical protein